MLSRLVLLIFWISSSAPLFAQQKLDLATVTEKLDKEGKVAFDQGKIIATKYDFTHNGETVEAITFRPSAEGKYPGVLMIPGYSRTAADYLPMGLRFAREGFASVAITPPGFGKSTGKPDFVGPRTIDTIDAGFKRFRQEPYVDASHMGLFGYSRGAMAASLLAVRYSEKELQAAVFAAGIYDMKKAYDEITLAGIKDNMKNEAGLSEDAFSLRSSIHKMTKLPCPVLILHGEKDVNAPVNQAKMLRDKLDELKKPYEIKLFPDRDHDLGRQNLNDSTIAFFRKHLKK